ncbi:hypothetical protein ACT17_15345 [Mycolicibacterium conceptionense]|uniref:Uncharacterized protein n=1 Tax=Mycolicibacterium conceptionense TaxID=451644 RepID=A0A0J8UBA0_9MYCO|nr:GAF domain-containing protein [Mycolicibacterium conceptionense]KMV17650.1 hypothetical protein ACT17_15345 [Mycolicibacterium conceptionense]
MSSARQWILAATLIDSEPRVIALGRTPRQLKSIESVVRGPRRKAIQAAIAAAVETQSPVDKLYAREGYRVVAEPFLSPIGRVNAVRVCTVPYRVGDDCADELPERLPVGAWVWDLNRSVILPSPEVYDLYRVPRELRKTELSALEWLSDFAQPVRTPATTLAASVVGADGEVMHDQLAAFRHDGVLREMRVAMRIEQSGPQRWLHGVTCDVTEGVAANEPPSSFAEAVMDADLASQEGVVTAVFDLRDLRPVRWLSDPPATMQWRQTGDPERDPAVHPEDMVELRRLGRAVLDAPVHGQLRVRGVDGSWVTVHCSAVLMSLLHEQGVSGALVKIREVAATGDVQAIPQR